MILQTLNYGWELRVRKRLMARKWPNARRWRTRRLSNLKSSKHPNYAAEH